MAILLVALSLPGIALATPSLEEWNFEEEAPGASEWEGIPWGSGWTRDVRINGATLPQAQGATYDLEACLFPWRCDTSNTNTWIKVVDGQRIEVEVTDWDEDGFDETQDDYFDAYAPIALTNGVSTDYRLSVTLSDGTVLNSKTLETYLVPATRSRGRRNIKGKRFIYWEEERIPVSYAPLFNALPAKLKRMYLYYRCRPEQRLWKLAGSVSPSTAASDSTMTITWHLAKRVQCVGAWSFKAETYNLETYEYGPDDFILSQGGTWRFPSFGWPFSLKWERDAKKLLGKKTINPDEGWRLFGWWYPYSR